MFSTKKRSDLALAFLARIAQDFVGQFLEFGYKEAVHVLGVRVEAATQVQRGMQVQAAEFGETRLAETQAGRHKFDVAFLQRIVYHLLAFVHQNRAGRVDQKAAAFRVRVQ